MSNRIPTVDEIELSRARSYRLLATLLARPPGAGLLSGMAALGDDAPSDAPSTPWGRALASLGASAREISPAEAEREYNRLFIGLERGEVVPYASYYVTGFLHDRPLVELRGEMARLGVAREEGVPEPEDHIAAILEIMAGLIDGSLGAPATAEAQEAFRERHLDRWAPRFFRDLERASQARFYKSVGAAGALLLEIEREAAALAQ